VDVRGNRNAICASAIGKRELLIFRGVYAGGATWRKLASYGFLQGLVVNL
jgi:hypothetical protein